MKNAVVISLVCVSLLLASCGREQSPTSPGDGPVLDLQDTVDQQIAAGEMALVAGWGLDDTVDLPAELATLVDKAGRCFIRDFQRQVLVGDIVHYSIVLAVGPGEHDVIGLHRVVRESRPRRPIRTSRSMFLVHGMGKDFVGNFLPGAKSPILPDDLGFAVFMAQNDIDVWGIDSSYTLVPPGLDDLSFAVDWGLDKSIRDVRAGIGISRFVRFFTGSGYGKMTLLGYSQGAIMSYGLLNAEASRSPHRRSVEAFIPVDWGLDFDDPEINAIECENLAGYQALLDDGVYGFYDDPDGFYTELGILARDFPDEPSPHFEGFTNLEVLLFFTATNSPPSSAHWWAASFDDDGIPVAYNYSSLDMVAEFWIWWAPMSPATQLWVDFHAILCTDSIWEDNLGGISLPVFSLEAAGGSGPGMATTLDRLASADVTRHVVQLQASEDVLLDFGHVDLFTADNAETEAWQQTLDWYLGVAGRHAVDPPDFNDVLGESGVAALLSLEVDVPEAAGHDGPIVSRVLAGINDHGPGWSVRGRTGNLLR